MAKVLLTIRSSSVCPVTIVQIESLSLLAQQESSALAMATFSPQITAGLDTTVLLAPRSLTPKQMPIKATFALLAITVLKAHQPPRLAQ